MSFEIASLCEIFQTIEKWAVHMFLSSFFGFYLKVTYYI